jgi:putative membrane protein
MIRRGTDVIEDPYAEFRREEMILRDWLALDRTSLANKRTFLSYTRTSIALVAIGLAFIKLIHHPFFEKGGCALIGFGIVVLFIGLREFIQNSIRFNKLIEKEKDLEYKLETLAKTERDAG